MQFWGGRGKIGVQCMLACGRPPLAPTIDPKGGGAGEQGGAGGTGGEIGGNGGNCMRGGAGRGGEGEPSASLPTLACRPAAHCPQCICTDSSPFNPPVLYFS